MVDIDDYSEVKECIYKDEHYSVRDNGAIMRHGKEGMRKRKLDEKWTFGIPNILTGYLDYGGERVHRIVATAFHGEAPSVQHVVDHKDTNRHNNRPENLRWLTRLENVLNNPITRARIENICGSIEVFLADPSVLRGHEKIDPNFSWMRGVTPEEAHVSYENLMKWAQERPKPQGGNLGEWVFQERKSISGSDMPISFKSPEPVESSYVKESLTPNAVQVYWRILSEFPCCPQEPQKKTIDEYLSNLKVDTIFCKNEKYSSLVVNTAIIDDGKSLVVMTRSSGPTIKPWALAKVELKDGVFIHESMGNFFDENGARKYFTLAQGLEWTGGDVLDDFC